MPLALRRANDDPPSYRMKYDGVEIGSISKRHHRAEHRDYWAWNIDAMPMMSHGGRPPSGEASNFEQAKTLFQHAFDKWRDGLPLGEFEENLIYKRQLKR
jgi:hypothetical protein